MDLLNGPASSAPVSTTPSEKLLAAYLDRENATTRLNCEQSETNLEDMLQRLAATGQSDED